MSIATKRKYVTQEVTDLILPEPPNFIARIVAGRGNNLHEIETQTGERCLVSMPTKFRKNVWVKRGDYVLCQPIAEGDKVKGEIYHVLYKDNIKYIKKHNLWPKEFNDDLPVDEEDELTKSDGLARGNAYLIDDDFLPSDSSEDESESDEDNSENKVET